MRHKKLLHGGQPMVKQENRHRIQEEWKVTDNVPFCIPIFLCPNSVLSDFFFVLAIFLLASFMLPPHILCSLLLFLLTLFLSPLFLISFSLSSYSQFLFRFKLFLSLLSASLLSFWSVIPPAISLSLSISILPTCASEFMHTHVHAHI